MNSGYVLEVERVGGVREGTSPPPEYSAPQDDLGEGEQQQLPR